MSSKAAITVRPPESDRVAAIFPLPLSDFEYYMLVDDRPSHPMVFVVVVQLSGCLQRPDFQQAVNAAVCSHPLFNCRILRIVGKGWCWVPLEPAEVRVHWQTLDAFPGQGDRDLNAAPVPLQALDLYAARGLEIRVEESEPRDVSRIVFYLHHACCDGIGALQFVGEVLARYGQQTTPVGQRQPEFVESQLETLLLREQFDPGNSARQRAARSLRSSLVKVGRMFLRRPVSLRQSMDMTAGSTGAALSTTAPATVDSQAASSPAVQTAVLPRAISRRLRRLAATLEVSVNDLLIREMMLQIYDWNQKSGGIQGDPWLRVAVPLSMRTSAHNSIPAANVVSYAFITRRAGECRNPARLLASISRQTGDVIFNREGLVFLKCIRAMRMIPGLLRALLAFKSCFCTVVLANMGNIHRRFAGRFPLHEGRWRAGNVIVRQICGVAPVRPNTRAAVTIGDYGGQTSIHLRTDPLSISDADSRRFLHEFSQRLIRITTDAKDAASETGTAA